MAPGAAVEMGVGMEKNPDQGRRSATGRFLHPSNSGMPIRAICCQDWQGYYTFSSSLPALSLSTASHITVSGVLPLVIPPLG